MKTKLTSVIFATSLFVTAPYINAAPTVEVYKSPTCGCCAKWVDHMRDNGFTVKTRDIGNKEIREKVGISNTVGSCHTALINGYAFEGHVPAQDIKRFLRERPSAVGLAVPDMPHGTPGMEGKRSDPYSVLMIKNPGETRRETTVYNRYDPHAPKKSQAVHEPKQGGSMMRLQ